MNRGLRTLGRPFADKSLDATITRKEHLRMAEIKSRLERESLRQVRKDYPVPLGTLARFRDGHIPTDPKARAALRLPIYPKKSKLPFADRVRMSCSEKDAEGVLTFYEFLEGRLR